MAATPISASSRYIPPGTRQYYFVPSIATKAAPSRAELNAGTDLTGEIADVSGFQTTSESQETPDLGTRFTSKIPGRITADDSSITMYASEDSQDVRQLLPRDTTGFIVQFPEGDEAGKTMDVFPVKVASAPKMTDIEDPAKIEVQFTITSEPAEDVTVPAA
ncbi:phage tail tube protein [Streptomyces antibioticus]|uniref:phage tail tube protein n=1 Tax=Streptomyces antibioticus TaxID=1890 RepID=UPI00369DFAE4